jgi:isoquinoline 1-oxidoreductase alpha subunit
MDLLTVNGARHQLDVEPETPLLWVLRDTLGLTGTKFGCGRGLCGACTVLVDGEAVRSCVTPVAEIGGKAVLTIEALAQMPEHRALIEAWVDLQVAQCGYCQPGQIMTAAALLKRRPSPSDAEIVQTMSGNLCRCGTYNRVCKAVRSAAGSRAP